MPEVKAGTALVSLFASRKLHPLADARGRVPVSVRLSPGEDARSLGLIEVAPGIGARWVEQEQLGSFVDAERARSPWVSPPLHPVMDRSGKLWTHANIAHVEGVTGKGTVVGIIDTGADIMHADLRGKDGKTRIAWMLDLATSATGTHAALESKFGCNLMTQAPCGIYDASEIDAMVAAGNTTLVDQVGHGTHVAGISAGNGGKSKFVGVAPEATLVVVRVTRQSGSESITDIDILNAVNFVFDRAAAMGMPAVVNVSLGGDYGPHDGTSALEQGLAAFVGPGYPGRSIVVAAGNSGGIVSRASDNQQYGPHTEAHVVDGAKTRVVLSMPSESRAVNGGAYVWITMQQGDEVRVGLERNGKEVLPLMGPGEQGAVDESGAPYMAVINGVVAENSPLSPNTTGAVVAITGAFNAADRFSIVLEGRGSAQLWVQGVGDAAYGSSTGGSLFLNPLKQGTVNVPATHPDLIAVGCTVNRLDWPNINGEHVQVKSVGALEEPPGDTACYFSGAGPNARGVAKPEIAAPGAYVAAAMSQAADPRNNPASMFTAPSERCSSPFACFVVDETHAIASGTSMSAPHVTGAVALLFEKNPTLTQPQVLALLQAGSRPFEGIVPLEFQIGPGALDVEGSLRALAESRFAEEAAPRGFAPDVQRSWLQVSSGYARPDGKFPLVGTVMLRAVDGGPASATELSKLTVSVENGVVASGPTGGPVPGVYQFEVVAPPGSGGKQLGIVVQYDGQEIGRRSIPIGTDHWATIGVASAHGGCSVAQQPTRALWPLGGLFALTSASLLVRRRCAQRETKLEGREG